MAILTNTDVQGTLSVTSNLQSTSSSTGSLTVNGNLTSGGNLFSSGATNIGNGDLRFLGKRSWFTPTSESSAVGHFPLAWNNYRNGLHLNTDEFFASGSNGISIYNNSGGSGVQHFRETAGSDVPNNSGVWLRIRVTAGQAKSPGVGGWYFANTSAVNSLIMTSFVARIPSGRNVIWASNSIGNGGTAWWLTPTVGTGKWERYTMVVQCGRGGNSNTNFFWLDGPDTTFDWWLSSATAWRLDA
jgi:hypothetical protein